MSHNNTSSIGLQSRLAASLPTSIKLTFHHVISNPCACPEVFAAAPGEIPEQTTSESHFFSASIRHEGRLLQVFALEIYVYTTATLTTIFVSKADSTGYLHLLELPKGTLSPIKTTITTFLEWLVDQKKREDARLLLSLFARAQSQYLFPGSVENTGKHVLDDRGLIRWWCRVLDPLLHKYTTSETETNHTARAHLVVPGLDVYETRAYFPKSHVQVTAGKSRWSAIDPLESIGKSADLPTRCYIPRFPDDPKARFVIDLDDELPEEDESELNRKGRTPGIWKSVKSLAEFWELMAFRQECAAGRLVGFIWAVFEPAGLVGKPLQAVLITEQAEKDEPTLPTPRESQHHYLNAEESLELTDLQTIDTSKEDLPTPVPSSQPQAEERVADKPDNLVNELTETSSIPARSKRIATGIQLDSEAYKKLLLMLDDSDYSSLGLAFESTAKFIHAALSEIDAESEWGFEIQGEHHVAPKALNDNATNGTTEVGQAVNVLSVNTVRSKKRPIEDTVSSSTEPKQPEVRILSASSIRKKPKS